MSDTPSPPPDDSSFVPPSDTDTPAPSNPFREGWDTASFTRPDPELVRAELVGPRPPIVRVEPPHRKRTTLWPAFVGGIAAIVFGALVSGLVLAVAAIVTGDVSMMTDRESLLQFMSTEVGLATMILPGQLTLLVVAIVASHLSNSRIVTSLGLGRGVFPVSTWPLFFFGTPVVAMVASFFISMLVQEPSEQMKMFQQLFSEHSRGALLYLILMISIVPGVAEEVLFRGFMQRRLLTRLPVAASIFISTVFFAGAHLDPMHAFGVFPLGIWLGIVAWRADSIWPAIFGHAGNNAFAIASSVFQTTDLHPAVISASPAIFAVCLLSFIACVLIVIHKSGSPFLCRTAF